MTSPRPEPMLVGRDEELALIDGLLARGRDRGEALLLHGDAGIGKSAIAGAAIRRARDGGATVLTTTGAPSEADLPYACLHQLIGPVLDDADALPDPQRAALDAALDGGAERRADPYRTGLAVLGLLGDAAERAPVVVVAEDAHWVDPPTSEVLAFVARRIEADAITMLITSRDGIPRSIRGAGLPTRRLDPLSADAADALLRALDPQLSPTARKRVLEQAEGNPLGLVELLTEAMRVGSDPALPAWLPLTTRLERAFAARVGDLPAETRTTLLVAALTDRADVTELLEAAAALVGHPLTLDVLTPAAAAGLVEIDEARVRFAHPLMRSAIDQGASDGARRAAHTALAQVLAADPDRAVWHRVAAAAGTDDALADELAAVAHRAGRRGSAVTAARTLGRAAQLTGGDEARGARLLDAAELALEIGRDDLVGSLLADVTGLSLAADDVHRSAWLHETARREAPDPAWFSAYLDRVGQLLATGDVPRASQALLTVAFRRWWASVPREVDDRIIAAAHALPEPADVVRIVVLSLAAPTTRGPEVARAIDRLEPDAVPAELLRLLAVSGALVGSFERAVVLGDRAIERLRARGRYGLLAPALVGRAWAGVFAGNWSASLAAAEDAARVSRETDQVLWAVSGIAVTGALTGLRGDLPSALALADEAEATLPAGAADGMRALIELARGLAQLAAGAPLAAQVHFDLILDADTPWHAAFIARWCVADAADAAALAGDAAGVAAVIAQFADAAGRSAHLDASLAYARVLAAGDDDIDVLAADALAACAGHPVLRARVQLAHGAALRRRRHAASARGELRAARDAFEALGMGPLAQRAREELRAAGEASRAPVADIADVLSPQELQIAEMAAGGMSNREIGSALYLSHRTIGSHLYRIFPKLGIASRAELRTLLAP
ncbi:AAA family ATPase [Svornostia abyssi]|uniref:AAA family ATPase n=1 Tax=Svornostia abyssi TaxID=2898438 RepID=A0ABY5PCF7_9ACTN|nr:AAA family ATPase [Parviterribacteraceae bacterium J379]